MSKLAMLFLLVAAGTVCAGGTKIYWPPLSEFSAVTDRAATAKDVEAGAAVFVLQDGGGKPIGVPINIRLPQYAYHLDGETGNKTPCVVVQAEVSRGQRMIGAYELPERTMLAGLYSEFQLLGVRAPASSRK